MLVIVMFYSVIAFELTTVIARESKPVAGPSSPTVKGDLNRNGNTIDHNTC